MILLKVFIFIVIVKTLCLSQTIKIACAQVSYSKDDFEYNAIKILSIINQAADSGADIVIIPEGMLTGYTAGAGVEKAWVEAKMALFGQECAKRNIGAMIGSTRRENTNAYVSAFLIGKDGKLIGTYDKVGLSGSEGGHTKGMGFPVYNFDHNGHNIKIGMQICRDQRYFAGFRILAQKGAQIILHQASAEGSSTFAKRNAIRAQLRSRAVSNSLIIASVNMTSGSQLLRSSLIDPRGRILNTTTNGNEQMICATFNIADADHKNLKLARNELYEIREK